MQPATPLTRFPSRLARFVHSHTAPALGLVSGVAALALYGQALSLPIYHDDAPWLKSIRDLNLVSLFAIKGDRPYYRPAAFAPWLVILDTARDQAPLLIHLYTFTLFVLCGWLAGLVARRFAPGKAWIAWGTMALFVVFPFTYQTVTWASAHVHLQPLACTLASILLLDRWLDRPRGRFLAGAWALMAIGIFTHENGPIMPVLLAGWLLIVRLRADIPAIRRELPRLGLALSVPFVLAALYAIIWISLTRGAANQAGNQPHIELASIAWNVAFLAQGIAYPVTLLGGPIVAAGAPDLITAAALDVLGIGLLGGVLWATKDRRLLILPWWYAASIAPAALFLPSNYIVDAPRMMTTGSFVAALGWAAAIGWLWERLRGAARFAPAALAGLMLVSGAWFIAGRMAMEAQIGPLYWEVMRRIAPESPGVVVNLPAWISPETRVFALGSEGIAYLPDYYPFSDLVWANTGITPHSHPIFWPEIAPALPGYQMGFGSDSRPQTAEARLQTIHNNDQIIIVRTVDGRLQAESSARQDTPPPNAARFSDGIWLGASALWKDRHTLSIRLVWETTAPDTVTPFVHLSCDGQTVTQDDGAPLGGLHPFEEWTPGERWNEERLVAIPREGACDPQILVGLYHPENGQRVPLDAGGDSVEVPVYPQ